MDRELKLGITGMSCDHCVRAVRRALEERPGVTVEHVGIGTARLHYDADRTNINDILDAVNDEGYDASVVA